MNRRRLHRRAEDGPDVLGRRTPPARYYVALTGTPGVGKSAVARALPARYDPLELGELALALGTAQRTRGRTVEIDLQRTRERLPPPQVAGQPIVGHLAHLLPVRYVILLRCHPVELARRLGRAHRGTTAVRRENVAAEAIDLILAEAHRAGGWVVQLDTSGRSVGSVARRAAAVLHAGGRGASDAVDWLADPAVTDYLLRHTP